jgi:hypothetical protein
MSDSELKRRTIIAIKPAIFGALAGASGGGAIIGSRRTAR